MPVASTAAAGSMVVAAMAGITRWAPGYIDAYNWYSQRQLVARFGRDIAAECESDAAGASH